MLRKLVEWLWPPRIFITYKTPLSQEDYLRLKQQLKEVGLQGKAILLEEGAILNRKA